MARSFRELAPDRVVIVDGGGAIAVLGLPFLAGGLFVWLALFGLLPRTGSVPTAIGQFFLGLLATVFTTAGAALAFGRAWTTVDASRREIIVERGLLWPMHRSAESIASAALVSVAYRAGDSDTAPHYPLTLRTPSGGTVKVGSFPDYAAARRCAAAVARLLNITFEDATGDQPQQLPAADVDRSLREQRTPRVPARAASRPASMRSTIAEDGDRVRITIPNVPMHPLVAGLRLLPLVVPFILFAPLREFFLRTATPPTFAMPVVGATAVLFVLLPVLTTVVIWLRSRLGATIVTASRDEVRVEEKGFLLTKTRHVVAAADILDIDVSSTAALVAAARVAGHQRVRDIQSPGAAPVTAGPNTERLLRFLTRFAKGRGIAIKSRQGITRFGAGLEDDEVRYLHAVVRRTLID